MRIQVLSICKSRPKWIESGISEYTKRLPKHLQLSFKDCPPIHRHKRSAIEAIEHESKTLLDAIPANEIVIALDRQGSAWSSEKLATQLDSWMHSGQNITLLIGGPDGLSPACLKRANQVWSLSALTFPHALVGVMIAEQIYRASCILGAHPYHR